MLFEVLTYVYMLFLATVIVCDLWLMWDNYKTNKHLKAMDREKELRFAKFRQVEHQFLK